MLKQYLILQIMNNTNFFIGNLVAKAPDLNLDKKNKQLALQPWGLESVANILYIFSLPKRDLYFSAIQWLMFILPEDSSRKTISTFQYLR